MSNLRVHIAVSADGYVAGPNQSEENPLGEGGESLHDWAFPLKAFRELHGREGGEVNASNQVLEEAQAKTLELAGTRPYDLRHSFCSLLIHEGATVVEIARQLGHSPTMSLDTYGHVFDEFQGSDR